MKSPQAKLAEALRGRVTRHHRFLLQLHLQQIDGLDASLGALDREIEANLGPFCIAVDIVSTHPGINKLSAEAIVSEIGADMSRFATAGHLLSWAHLCPRNDESAGKRRSSRLRQGGRWLKTTLVQCAHAAKNKRGSYYQAQYLRLRSHLRCRRLHSHRHLPYAQERNRLSGPRRRPLLSALQRNTRKELTQTPRAHGLCRTNYAARRLIAVAP